MTERTKWTHVELPGHGTFWIDMDRLKQEGGSSALAPEEHMEDGELVRWWGESYAHVFSDRISRFGQPIGHPDDLKVIP